MRFFVLLSVFLISTTSNTLAQFNRAELDQQIDAEIQRVKQELSRIDVESPEAKKLRSQLTWNSAARRSIEIFVTYLVVAPSAVFTAWFASSIGAENLQKLGALPIDHNQISFALPILISTGAGMIFREVSTRVWDHVGERKYKLIDEKVNALVREYAIRSRAALEDAERAIKTSDAKLLAYSISRLNELGKKLVEDATGVREGLLQNRTFFWNRLRRKFARLRVTQGTYDGLVDLWTLQLQLLKKLKSADDVLLEEVVGRMQVASKTQTAAISCAEAIDQLNGSITFVEAQDPQ